MTDRTRIILMWAAIVAAALSGATACFAQPSGAPTPLPPRPGLASPTEQVPMPKRSFDPSRSTAKPEDCVDGTIWSPVLRGCLPPWSQDVAPPLPR